MDENLLGEQFLYGLYPQIHTTPPVEWIQSQLPPDKRSQIWGSLWLNGLQSAEELRLPNEIWGHLNLSGLKSAEGLVLPNEIRGRLYLSDLLKKNLKNNYSKF